MILAFAPCARAEAPPADRPVPARTLTPAELDQLSAEGERAYRGGQWLAALDAFRTLVAVEPEHRQGWLRVGNLQQQRGEYDQAAEAYRRAAGRGEPGAVVEPEVRSKALLNLASVNVELARAALDDAKADGALLESARDEIRRELAATASALACAPAVSATPPQPVAKPAAPSAAPKVRAARGVRAPTAPARPPSVEYLSGGPQP